MRFRVFIILFLLFFSPVFVYADCSKTGVTVVFINGIFGNEDAAKSNRKDLEYQYKIKGIDKSITFINGYNESHAGGAVDLVSSVIQAYNGGYLDHDLTDILRQVHNDLKTQKIILVGHSQGTFYTNAAYDYLVEHGVDKKSITVYNIGTPADRVAGNGKYLNSSTDGIINLVIRDLTNIGFARKPLPPNIDIKIPNDNSVDYQEGHSFSKVYLALAPDRIIGDMDQGLKDLTADSNKDECFVQPAIGTLYLVIDEGYRVVDNFGKYDKYYVVTGINDKIADTLASLTQKTYDLGKQLVLVTYNFGKQLVSTTYDFGKQLVSEISHVVAQSNFLGASLLQTTNQNTTNNPPVDQTTPIDQTVNIPAPVVDDTSFQNTPDQPEISLQDQLDDIQEKLDVIDKQLHDLVVQRDKDNQEALKDKDNTVEDKNKDNTNNKNIGGGAQTTYSKILISEIQIEPIGQRFIEFYNPSNTSVQLDGWYLQRKTQNADSWESLVSSSNFANKSIPAGGYFLISRELANSNILSDITLSDDNSLALKNPNGEISDKLGFGNVSDSESAPAQEPILGKSIGRKVLTDWIEQDSDNNLNDFVIDIPTPKSQNTIYVAPPSPTANVLISELQIDGVEGTGGTDDDWVELYNPNSVSISLKGWSIQKHSSDSPCSMNVSFKVISFPDNAIIPVRGYYLVARNNASQNLLDIADMTSSYLQLSDDNTIYLVKSQDQITSSDDINIVDRVGYGQACFSENSPVINPAEGKSVGRKVLVDGTEQDTNDNLSDFEIDTPTPKSQNTTYSAPLPKDVTAPQATFNITATQYDLNFPVSFNITDPIIGTVSPSGVSSYIFRWQEDGGDWNADDVVTVSGNPTSKDFLRNFTGQDGKTYNFQVKATDIDGNTSDWLPQTPATTKIKLITKILINEIQVDPTSQRFIELYNPNSTDVDLTGWYLQRETSGGTIGSLISSSLFAGKIIKAGGYFLISRQQMNGSDILLSTMTLSPDNSLFLKNQDRIIVDEVGYGTARDFEIAPAENPLSGQSIQRRWDTINNKTQNTVNNSVDFEIFNATTPKFASPKYYLFSGFTFSTNTTLKKMKGPFLFSGINWVSAGVTLTIELGTTLKFSNSIIRVDGTINAVGTESQKIAFTSINDIDYGGDIRSNGDTSPVNPGQWTGIVFNQDSVGSDLENVVVRYAGGDIVGYIGAGIKADQTSIILKNSIIQSNSNGGVDLENSASIIDSDQFLDNYIKSYDYGHGIALFANGNNPEIKNCVFKRNYDSVYLTNNTLNDSSPIVQNNDFENNQNSIYMDSKNSYPDFSGNSAINNHTNAIIFADQIGKDITIKKDLTYLIQKALNVPQNITLTIEPGTIIKFADSIIRVDGTLDAIGTVDQPIIFTSVDDNDYGAVVWPWNDTPASPGQWSGIIFNQDSVGSDLENVAVRYAGGYLGGYAGAGVMVNQAAIALKNSIIQNNILGGVILVNSPSIIDSVQFLSNKMIDDSGFVNGLYISGGSPTVENSYFAENNYGIFMDIYNGIKPLPVTIENNTFGPAPDPLDLENKVYGPNTIKDFYDASLPNISSIIPPETLPIESTTSSSTGDF